MDRNNVSDIPGRYLLWMGDAKGEKLRGYKGLFPLTDECIKLCKRYGRFHILPKAHSNIGYALEKEGCLEEGMSYFALAYYGHVIAGGFI